jgi:hypothetical protein
MPITPIITDVLTQQSVAASGHFCARIAANSNPAPNAIGINMRAVATAGITSTSVSDTFIIYESLYQSSLASAVSVGATSLTLSDSSVASKIIPGDNLCVGDELVLATGFATGAIVPVAAFARAHAASVNVDVLTKTGFSFYPQPLTVNVAYGLGVSGWANFPPGIYIAYFLNGDTASYTRTITITQKVYGAYI